MSHTTVETETASDSAEPIGFLPDGRPVYEEGGRLVANSNGAPADAGATGARSGEPAPTGQPANTSGSNSGGTPAANAPTGSAEGSAQASGVDEGSTDAGSGQQTPEPDLTNLKKAIASERTLRKQAEADLRAEKLKNASAEERQLEEAKTQAATEAEARVKQPLLRNLAATELRAAGIQGPTARLVGLLDLNKIEIDEDGEISGLIEQVEALKTEFPNMFQASSSGRAPAPNANGGSGSRSGRAGDNGAPAAPKKWNEILAEQVFATGAGTPGVSAR